MKKSPGARPIFLAGFMCAGKTLAGRALARALRLPFADSDAAVEKAAGAKISAIVKGRGWAFFRRAEAAAVRELAGRGGVIALGGGFYPTARRGALLGRGVTVFLSVPWRELEKRLEKARGTRPLLAGVPDKVAARAEKLYKRRLPYYRRCAVTVDAAGLTPDRAAARIAAALKDKK